MNGVIFAAFIIVVFFAAGMALGVTTILSLSATRRRRQSDDWPEWPPDN